MLENIAQYLEILNEPAQPHQPISIGYQLIGFVDDDDLLSTGGVGWVCPIVIVRIEIISIKRRFYSGVSPE